MGTVRIQRLFAATPPVIPKKPSFSGFQAAHVGKTGLATTAIVGTVGGLASMATKDDNEGAGTAFLKGAGIAGGATYMGIRGMKARSLNKSYNKMWDNALKEGQTQLQTNAKFDLNNHMQNATINWADKKLNGFGSGSLNPSSLGVNRDYMNDFKAKATENLTPVPVQTQAPTTT